MHIPVRWQFLQLTQVQPFPGAEKAQIDCNSCFHLVDGQRPRPTLSKQLFPKLRIGGGTYDLVSQTNYWCYLYRLRSAPATNITIWATNAKRQKNLV